MWAWFLDLIRWLEPYFQFPYVIGHLIDIVVMAFIVYQILLFIQKTRAEQVLKGLIMLFFIYFISKWIHLNTISWVLENTIDFGIIAAIIVFQPELRRALEKIGRGGFLQKVMLVRDEQEHDYSKTIEDIVKAVDNMSKKKTGALIVIERETGINDIIETGVKLDAKVTRELLENIFVPNTPLHDGAVVVRGERVAAAGCFLPLTENPNLSKQLGTRHRAALGISESSDAFAIIVSEETGIVSSASGGKLTRYLDSKGLHDMLAEIYSRKPENRTFNFIRWRSRNE